MAIIVLALTLAVPAIRALTGSKSQQAAQNTISAFFSRVRAEAIGLQKVQGVLFYVDPGNGRVTMAQVQETAPELGFDVPSPQVTYLDLTPDHDTLSLPPGITVLTLKGRDPLANGNADLFPLDHYLGFNTSAYNIPASATGTTSLGGVILFDGHGRTIIRRYGFRYATHPLGPTGNQLPPQVTALGSLAFGSSNAASAKTAADWPPRTGNKFLQSQVSFVLLDRESYQAQVQAVSAGTGTTGPDNPQQSSIVTWADQNATPVFVNRYNGTLIPAE